MKRKIKTVIGLLLIISIFGGCAMKKPEEPAQAIVSAETDEEEEKTAPSVSEEKQEGDAPDKEQQEEKTPADILSRPKLIKTAAISEAGSITPCVAEYTIEPDLSNIDNLWQYYFNEDAAEKLAKNGFLVQEGGGSEFFEIYEQNRYGQQPNFVTVDSLMHTYHLYFGHLLKSVEKAALCEKVSRLGQRMLADSIDQYSQLKDSEWEAAAKSNVAFFSVGVSLMDDSTEIIEEVKEIVDYELSCIESAGGISKSMITGDFEDYSQYKPRGYYEGDAQLEAYFKAMMWYGRIHFPQEAEERNRSALLITHALQNDGESYRLWESVYAVTSFFAGASDDLSVCEYAPVMKEAYGEGVTLDDFIQNKAAYGAFALGVQSLPEPQINSVPIMDGENNVIPGFRFMGQRFTIDAAIMQKLIYSMVKEDKNGMTRMLPDVLDVPAALGSDIALSILEEQGDTGYKGYTENMEKLRSVLAKDNETLWSASLYANWLDTLRPLLTVKGKGYPVFMQGEEWAKKDLECFAGSFTELKHDTILYSKQVIAEMGGGWDEVPDDRGYVEPEPLVYERFLTLTEGTAAGLKAYGMLNAADEENLARLSEIAAQLLTISKKELQEEGLTGEEYEFIRSYGGSIEHFWYEVMREETGEGYPNSSEYPAAIVVDIATDPNGQVLEAATGNPSRVYAVVKVEGKLKIASGSVYTFYQFPWPINDRLTDTEWRIQMGLQCDEEGNYNYETRLASQPAWTDSYRYRYEW